MTSEPGRRSFLRGLAGGAAGGVVAGAIAGGFAGYSARDAPADPAAAANAAVVEGRLPTVPFHGQHQAGILPVPARATPAGGPPPLTGIGAPPSDSGVLGPTVVPDGLRVTFGVGSTLFDDRYGLAALRPAHLTAMRAFPDD